MPTEEQLFHFVASTHECDRTNIPYSQITGTWQKKGPPSPYAHGHFKAFNYVLHQLLPSNDFPAKDPNSLHTIQDSHTALFWLREIHKQIAMPLAADQTLYGNDNVPLQSQVASYRMMPAVIVKKAAPPTDLIPALMHNWIITYAKFHHSIKDRVSNPYGIDKDTAKAIYTHCKNIPLFFCSVQPYACLNQRLGRFVEQVFRLAWWLPMKYYSPSYGDEYPQFLKDLEKYEDAEMPLLIKKL